jgi:hypothetical protein
MPFGHLRSSLYVDAGQFGAAMARMAVLSHPHPGFNYPARPAAVYAVLMVIYFWALPCRAVADRCLSLPPVYVSAAAQKT